jgi:hypothetical protein
MSNVQPKSFTLDGKRYRLDDKVPAPQIRYLSGFWHVAVPDVEIREIIERRATANRWPVQYVEQAVMFAIKCHRENQKLYRSVML